MGKHLHLHPMRPTMSHMAAWCGARVVGCHQLLDPEGCRELLRSYKCTLAGPKLPAALNAVTSRLMRAPPYPRAKGRYAALGKELSSSTKEPGRGRRIKGSLLSTR